MIPEEVDQLQVTSTSDRATATSADQGRCERLAPAPDHLAVVPDIAVAVHEPRDPFGWSDTERDPPQLLARADEVIE
jgi:hypothetical protein